MKFTFPPPLPLQLTAYGGHGRTGVSATGCVEVDSSSGAETNSLSSTEELPAREKVMRQGTATLTTAQVSKLKLILMV